MKKYSVLLPKVKQWDKTFDLQCNLGNKTVSILCLVIITEPPPQHDTAAKPEVCFCQQYVMILLWRRRAEEKEREAGPRCSVLNWIKGQRLLRLPPAGWLPETLDQCLHHLTTCESDSFIQSSPTHLRDLNNTSQHNESNKPPHKHTLTCAHVTLMIVSKDKRKFADKFMAYPESRETSAAFADGYSDI